MQKNTGKKDKNDNGICLCNEYNYIDEPAVRDGNLITAAATGALDMTRLILEYLDVFGADTLEHWYAYFSTGNVNEFFAMMQCLQK